MALNKRKPGERKLMARLLQNERQVRKSATKTMCDKEVVKEVNKRT